MGNIAILISSNNHIYIPAHTMSQCLLQVLLKTLLFHTTSHGIMLFYPMRTMLSEQC